MDSHNQEFSINKLLNSLSDIKAIHIIIIFGFLAFFNCLLNGFVWDDKAFIINNLEVHTFNPIVLFGPNLFNFASYYRPIPAIYFAALYTLSGNSPFIYHLVQLILHMVNGVLLYYFFKTFFKKIFSLFLALIFVIHPIQVESVSFIAAAISVLFFLFGLSALQISKKTELHNWSLFWIFLLILCSLLTKETGILFIVMILLYRILFHKPVKSLSIVLCSTIPLYFFIRFLIGYVYFAKENLAPITRVDLLERLQTIPQIIFYYLKTVFFPITLAVEQHWVVTSVTINNFYFPLLIDCIFFLLLFFIGFYILHKNKKQFKIFIFFLTWFILGLGMHLQIIPLDMTVADRWFYFPLVGLLGMLGVIMQRIDFTDKKIKIPFLFLAILLLLVLATRTIIRNRDWRDPISLYMHDSKIEDNFSIENNLGAELGTVGRYDEALTCIKKSITLFPYETNYANLAFTYEKMGNHTGAKKAYKTALTLKGYNIGHHIHALHSYIGYVELLLNEKFFSQAEIVTKQGLVDYPNDSRLLIYLAYSEYHLNKQKEALSAAMQAYTISPNATTTEVYNRIYSKSPLKINFIDNPEE